MRRRLTVTPVRAGIELHDRRLAVREVGGSRSSPRAPRGTSSAGRRRARFCARSRNAARASELHAKALAFIDDVRHRAERERAAADRLRAQVVTVLVAELGVRYGRDIDRQPGAAENELPGESDAQRAPANLVADHVDAVVDVAADEAEVVFGAVRVVLLVPLAETAEHAEADRAFAQHPLVAHIDRAVADAPVPHRRSGVREFHLSRPEVFIVEIAAVDAPYARRRFEEQVIAEILAAEELQHMSVQILVNQHRGGVAERRVDALGVVADLGLAGA